VLLYIRQNNTFSVESSKEYTVRKMKSEAKGITHWI